MMPADVSNLVLSIVKSSDNVFAYFDWFELKEGLLDETPQSLWTNVIHSSANTYYSAATFAQGLMEQIFMRQQRLVITQPWVSKVQESAGIPILSQL